MDRLFYSIPDKTLYWIAGYTADGNTNNVEEITKSLTDNASRFAKMAGCELKNVRTHYNQMPPQYQYMRVFYVKTENIPDIAMKLERKMFDHLAGR